MILGRRTVIGGVAAGLGLCASTALRSAPRTVRHVGEFGARGDGVTNDTAALAAAAQFIESRGGGTLLFDRRTYLIGRQTFHGHGGWAYEPDDVITIRDCPAKLTLVGNGAVLRSAGGLRFGSFDPATGRPGDHDLPFYDASHLASPFRSAILLERNRGGIEISGFEIDGRITQAVIGGKWGDRGWQIPNHGISLNDNLGVQLVRKVHAHHLGGDGVVLAGSMDNEAPTQIDDCRLEFNGRQGLTIIGGRRITVSRTKCSHTGQNGVIDSNPHAGADIEAEGERLIRDVAFRDCDFINNAGAGFVADSGDSAELRFERCRFIGAVNYAIWPNKPGIRFHDSLIVGAAAGFYSDSRGGGSAPQFLNCRFSDDPSLSPTGKVYDARFDLAGSEGILFDGCQFDYSRMELPWTPPSTRFHNCRMSSRAPGRAQLHGIFTGENVIRGPADLSRSKFLGRVVHDGRLISGGLISSGDGLVSP